MSTVTARDPSATDRWLNGLAMLTVAGLALLLYSRALDFAFFNDDPSGHFAWMATRSLADFFSSAADYGYYRPVVFATLQSLVTATGYDPVPFHALLIVLHAANTGLLWLLAQRLGGSRPYAWTAALLFATLPFSYEAVAYVASLTHPLMVFWLLLALLLYQNMRAAPGRGWRLGYAAAAFIAVVLALLTHENGLFVVPALVGVEWLARPPRGIVEGLRRPFLPFFIAPLLYLILWLSIPKASEQGLSSAAEWASNMVPFLQTLVYPLLPALALNAEQVAALGLLALGSVAALAVAARLGQRLPLWAFALGWFFLSALPATLFLQPAYLYGSPRLQYLPGIGIALLWALPVPALLERAARSWAQLLAAVASLVYTLILVLPPVPFVQCELDFYGAGSHVVRQMAATASAAPANEPLTFVNVPFFFSSYAQHPDGCPNPYPWTPVGTVVVPPYAAARDFVRFNNGPDRDLEAVHADLFTPAWATHGAPIDEAALRSRLAAGAVHLFDLQQGSFVDLSTAWQPEQPLQTPLVLFGDGLALLDTTVTNENGRAALNVRLTWQAQRPWSETPVGFVHLYDGAGALVSQHDGPLAAGNVPADRWRAGDIIREDRQLLLPAEIPPGPYTLAAGLYNSVSGERYQALYGAEPLADNVLIFEQVTLP